MAMTFREGGVTQDRLRGGARSTRRGPPRTGGRRGAGRSLDSAIKSESGFYLQKGRVFGHIGWGDVTAPFVLA